MYRPLYHFSPPSGWMNDPNGLVYFEDKWHLFFQHTPDQVVWGPMHWGHAVSTNLVDWETCSIALWPDDLGTIYSGSAVVRTEKPSLVACFTHASDKRQAQSLAFSDDGGYTWDKFPDNPVLCTKAAEFRDPKVFRFDDEWRMIVCAGAVAEIYRSSDLVDWTFLAKLPPPESGGIWECPDLFQINDDWILLGSFAHWDAPAEASTTRYWIGSFNGVTFVPKIGPEMLSFGPDDYAAITWSNSPCQEKVLIGWMSHWAYARLTPTGAEGWRGVMTLPRLLSISNGRLVQRPPIELQNRRADVRYFQGNEIVINDEALELQAILEFSKGSSEDFHFRFFSSAEEQVVLSYTQGWLYIDRTASGLTDFHPDFARAFKVLVPLTDDKLVLEVFFDRCSIEVFAQGGQYYGGALVFPSGPMQRVVFEGAACLLATSCLFLLK